MNKPLKTKKIFLVLIGFYLFSLSFVGTGVAAPMNDFGKGRSHSTELKIASGGLTLLYFPLKVTYAALGGVVGGIAYVFTGGDEATAQAVWTPSIQGTYMITPEHLQGEKPVDFFGRTESETLHREFGFG